MTMPWTPAFGVHLEDGRAARVRICAPGASHVRLAIEDGETLPLDVVEPGVFGADVPGLQHGRRYSLQVDDHPRWPDPWSRWQPEGVHGPSMVIDPQRFAWTDAQWQGVRREQLVIYELHVGTFTPEGTFAAAAACLPALAELGVTAVELMPIAAFPGRRNWGYDGAAWFAPSEQYGHPDDVRAFVDRAHALGLAVLLDVVYNHLGPDGAYLAAFMPTFFTERHHTPWGRAINLDGPDSWHVRRIICDNAIAWLREYHLDGLRLDATHALIDDSEEHLLAQLAREVATHVEGRPIHLIAEDERNLATLMLPREHGGYGLTGVWADDFHHATRRLLAGDHEAWFSDFEGSTREIATSLARGWVFSGQVSPRSGRPRGTPPDPLPLESIVICVQNHDQVGNRAHGERLHHQVDTPRWLAASALLLTAPETPMLFMGQEWAASAPFLYFTDHEPSLGALVIEGRRSEFERFSAYADPEVRELIPDPQADVTFRSSTLRWDERAAGAHAQVLDATRRLLDIRRAHLMAGPRDRAGVRSSAPDAHVVVLAQPSDRGGLLVTVADLTGDGTRDIAIDVGTQAPVSTDRLFATGDHVTVDAAPDGSGRLRLQINAPSEPLGLVVHLTGASS